MKKALIFDSGALITLSMSGLLDILDRLKKGFDGEFLITRDVKYEVIDRPLKVPRFKLGAMMIESLLNKKVIILPEEIGINHDELNSETSKLLNVANHMIKIDDKPVSIVSPGEISCIALAKELTYREIESMIVIDERITRILVEKPENLEVLISQRLHKNAKTFNIPEDFRKIKIIRTPELVYVAYKKGLMSLEGKEALEAALFSTKYKGSSISFDEINVLKKL